jgi:hypothetical protein
MANRMEEECVEMYGMTGTFFTTNIAYVIPYPVERDFHPFPEMLPESDSDNDDDDYVDAVAPSPDTGPDAEPSSEPAQEVPAPAQEVDKATKTLIAKMREN